MRQQRTLASSGPPMFSGEVGVVQCLKVRSICALQSPCQMTLAWPVAMGIGCSCITQLAMSMSTP